MLTQSKVTDKKTAPRGRMQKGKQLAAIKNAVNEVQELVNKSNSLLLSALLRPKSL